MTTRIAHITDSHLSANRAYFVDNFRTLRGELAQLAPALVINTGDLTINGADSADDLRFAKACHERLGLPWRVIPGNHDVGEEPGAAHLDQPATQERLDRFEGVFGPCWWRQDVPGWRLIGVNAHLFGTELGAEAAQWAWLEETAGQGEGAVALFIHKPFFLHGPDDPADPAHCLALASRERLMALLSPALRLVCSGHLHQGLIHEVGGVIHVWGPSCGFPSSNPVRQDANVRVGYAVLDLAADGGLGARLVQPDVFVQHDYAAAKKGAPFLKDAPEVFAEDVVP